MLMKTMDELPELEILTQEYLENPVATVNVIRAHSTVARSSRGLEVLTYDSCAEVFNNKDFENAKSVLAARMGVIVLTY